jgi:hypothetical protein
MGGKITGGCACGAIRYESAAEPVAMLNCHCRDCQQASGSAYAAILVLPKAAVSVTGEPRYHKRIGDAGRAVERGFCPGCGSPIAMKLELMPDLLCLKAGSLDDPSGHAPSVDIFTASAQSWDHMDPKLSKFPQAWRT